MLVVLIIFISGVVSELVRIGGYSRNVSLVDKGCQITVPPLPVTPRRAQTTQTFNMNTFIHCYIKDVASNCAKGDNKCPEHTTKCITAAPGDEGWKDLVEINRGFQSLVSAMAGGNIILVGDTHIMLINVRRGRLGKILPLTPPRKDPCVVYDEVGERLIITGGSPTWKRVQSIDKSLVGEWIDFPPMWEGGGRRLHGCGIVDVAGYRHLMVVGGQGSRGPPWHKGRYRGQGWRIEKSVAKSAEIINLESEAAEWATLPDTLLQHIWRPGVVTGSGDIRVVGGLNYRQFWLWDGVHSENYNGFKWSIHPGEGHKSRRHISSVTKGKKSKAQVLCSYVWIDKQWCKNKTHKNKHKNKRVNKNNMKKCSFSWLNKNWCKKNSPNSLT